MAGFDNGTSQSGVFFQAKQFGEILRGYGPPVPQAGVGGDVYIDVQSWQLYTKRLTGPGDMTDPWGNWLFIVPDAYRTALKWFSTFQPGDDIGRAGDYCLHWSSWANYGMVPSIYGPKQANGWPESGVGGELLIALAGAGTVLPVGLTDEGATINMSNSTQLIALGLLDEYILAVPVEAGAGDPVQELGLQSGPALVELDVNPLYSAQNTNGV
jgi:hypothetical protein